MKVEKFRDRKNSVNTIKADREKRQQHPVVAMDSSSVEEQPASTALRNKPQPRDREKGERKKKGGNSRDSETFDRNVSKPGSMSNDNLDSLLHLKRALIKHDQSQVPGNNNNQKRISNLIFSSIDLVS